MYSGFRQITTLIRQGQAPVPGSWHPPHARWTPMHSWCWECGGAQPGVGANFGGAARNMNWETTIEMHNKKTTCTIYTIRHLYIKSVAVANRSIIHLQSFSLVTARMQRPCCVHLVIWLRGVDDGEKMATDSTRTTLVLTILKTHLWAIFELNPFIFVRRKNSICVMNSYCYLFKIMHAP